MKLNPPKGMRDILINEYALRSKVLDKIITGYKNAGFFQISTPVVEDIENISKSDGGDNLNLVFEILKRGDSLKSAAESGEKLSDMALRYDLTLPLCRFFSANSEKLPYPFKVIQTGLVYRAERPQKGRLREFRQCDIDILGDKSTNAEIELFCTSLNILSSLGFKDLCLCVNDRRILFALLKSFGFKDTDIQSVCITFDKLDKIGIEGVECELREKNFDEKSIENLIKFISSGTDSLLDVSKFIPECAQIKDLGSVIDTVSALLPKGFSVKFSPSLIRGQGYYTGIVAEVVSPLFKGAIAGGGRYDNLIGKFTGRDVPAVGFSIGFERIMNLLLDENKRAENSKKKIALVYKDSDDFKAVMSEKYALMKNGDVSLFGEAKNKRHFFDMLSSLEFDECIEFSSGSVKKLR